MKRKTLITILLTFTVLLLTACSNDSNELGSSNDDNNNDNATENNNTDDSLDDGDDADAYKVVIDPGHGGKDNGSTGADGHYEKEFTLSLGKRIQRLLEKESDVEVLMTRDDDSFISQESLDRPKYANKEDADIFVSLHQNSFEDPDVSGTESFYYDDESLTFAETMQQHVAQATGFDERGVTQESLFVLRDTDMPAVLIEVGYLTNPDDQEKMESADFQEQLAHSIVDGIEEYREG